VKGAVTIKDLTIGIYPVTRSNDPKSLASSYRR
jgi:hypothetical protein